MARFVVVACAFGAAVLLVFVYGFTPETLELLALAGLLGYATSCDLRERIIPNGCVAAAALVRLCYLAFAADGGLLGAEAGYYLLSCIALGGLLAAFALVFERVSGRAGMGGGDVKLYAIAGLYLGFEAGLAVVLLSCIIGALSGLIASAAQKPARELPSENGESVLQRTMPFGPFIAFAMVIGLLAKPFL